MQKQIANAMPTCARAFARVAGVETSDKIALRKGLVAHRTPQFIDITHIANCTLPSLKPPTTRERR